MVFARVGDTPNVSLSFSITLSIHNGFIRWLKNYHKPFQGLDTQLPSSAVDRPGTGWSLNYTNGNHNLHRLFFYNIQVVYKKNTTRDKDPSTTFWTTRERERESRKLICLLLMSSSMDTIVRSHNVSANC